MSKNLKALLLYIFLSLILTWPLLPHILTHYPSTFNGEGGDPNMYIWFMDTVAQKVTHPSFHPGQLIFYPAGINFLAGYEAPIILPVGVPIILLTHNPILAYNLILLAAFILTAYCCYLLILYLTDSFFAALITGFTFGFSPYMMVRGVQHLDLLLLFTVPLVILRGLKLIDNPSKKNILWLTAAVLLTALSAWYYLVGSLIFLLLLALFNLKKIKEHKREFFLTTGAVGLVLGLAALPMFINRSSFSSTLVDQLIDKRGAELANFFVPHPYTQLWTWPVYNSFWSPYEATSYFGIVGLIAIIVLCLFQTIKIPYRKLWITAMILFTVIAIGTYLEISHYHIWMPFSLLRKFIPFSKLRAPNRFFVFAYMSATIVFGYFLANARNWFTKSKIGILVLILLISLLTAERFMMPYPLITIAVPEFYKNLAKDDQKYAIVDVPLADTGVSLYDYYQLYHKKAIVEGEYFWTSYNKKTFELINNNNFLASVYTGSCSSPKEIQRVNKSQALANLAENNIKYIVVHNLIFSYNECNSLLSAVHIFFRGQKPVYADGEITVYATNPQ